MTMATDSPYYIEARRSVQDEMIYHIFCTGEGLVCEVYGFTNARLIVEALNRLALERAVARHT